VYSIYETCDFNVGHMSQMLEMDHKSAAETG